MLSTFASQFPSVVLDFHLNASSYCRKMSPRVYACQRCWRLWLMMQSDPEHLAGAANEGKSGSHYSGQPSQTWFNILCHVLIGCIAAPAFLKYLKLAFLLSEGLFRVWRRSRTPVVLLQLTTNGLCISNDNPPTNWIITAVLSAMVFPVHEPHAALQSLKPQVCFFSGAVDWELALVGS